MAKNYFGDGMFQKFLERETDKQKKSTSKRAFAERRKQSLRKRKGA